MSITPSEQFGAINRLRRLRDGCTDPADRHAIDIAIQTLTGAPEPDVQDPHLQGFFFRDQEDIWIECYTPSGRRSEPDFDGHRYARPLYTSPVNLACKSTQKRLATQWGYVLQSEHIRIRNHLQGVVDRLRSYGRDCKTAYLELKNGSQPPAAK